MSVSRPSSGVRSALKSPVWNRVPAGVVTAIASASGIEWLTATNSHTNGPKVTLSPLATSCSSESSRRSVSLASSSPRVNLEPTSGARRPASMR